jgi:hypothetical protein
VAVIRVLKVKRSSNAGIAAISANGLITATFSGTVVIQATNDGAAGIISTSVLLGGDSVGGLPVSWIIANRSDQSGSVIRHENSVFVLRWE